MSDFVKAFKKRSKNYVFWTALFALIGGIVVNHFNLIDAVEYQDFINLLLAFYGGLKALILQPPLIM